MLGDKPGQETGKVVLRRVLPSGPGAGRTETTQRGHATLLVWTVSTLKNRHLFSTNAVHIRNRIHVVADDGHANNDRRLREITQHVDHTGDGFCRGASLGPDPGSCCPRSGNRPWASDEL